jgi:hypothetical protein
MSSPPPQCRVFGAEELLPEPWKKFARNGPVRVFNPGLLRDHDRWLFAYRVVAPDGLRRIAICRLDPKLNVIEGSQIALTDFVRIRTDTDYPESAKTWFADPRLYRLSKRLFVYWNSGWHEPRNYQFVQELNPITLLPEGRPREMLLRGGRQKLEKNWTFFQSGDHAQNECRAIYSIIPHRVLAFSLAGDADIIFDEVARQDWTIPTYPPSHGGLRGGAPPVEMDGRFWSFCHSVHDDQRGYRYAAAAYAFAAAPPYRPLMCPALPLDLANEFTRFRNFPPLNPAVGAVIYPCGAAREGARWLISHGINDELCAISSLDHTNVLATVHEVVPN